MIASRVLPFSVVGLALCALPLAQLACGGDAKPAADATKTADTTHIETLTHEPCDESGHRVDALDANNDGKPDVKKVYKGDHEICRITDLNRDGKPDLYEYFDASGQLRRREADYDANGTVDAVEYYEGGKLARRELDTTGQHRIDTWDTLDPATGKMVKRERDTTNDGKVDQWWTWDGDQVTIASDKTGDGKPDPDSVVIVSTGAAAAKSAAVADGGVAASADGGAKSTALVAKNDAGAGK